jgi:hypothetical protein
MKSFNEKLREWENEKFDTHEEMKLREEYQGCQDDFRRFSGQHQRVKKVQMESDDIEAVAEEMDDRILKNIAKGGVDEEKK